ncbi:MAG: TonB family protein, partial [Cyclobacteriaceae bacterium]
GGNRTVSGLNGQFELTGVGVGSTLSFSGQGLVSRDVVVENAEPINTVLSPAATSEKVAIIGYDNVVNKSPEPANGRNAFRQYVNNSLQYPEAARSQQIEGVVVLKVTVSSDGSVNNIEVKKSLSASCDQEAVRLIEEGPQWTPATYNGDPVEGSVRVRIIFDM